MNTPLSETIIFLLIFFWLAHIIRRTIFFLYFWQLKEYRWDRFFSAFKERKTIVFQKILILPAILLILLLAGFFPFAFEYAVFAFYFIAGLSALALILFGKWRFPKPTIKMLALAALVVAGEMVLAMAFVTKFLILVLALDVFLAVYIALCVGIFQIPVTLAKKTFEWRAGWKIKKMKNLTVVAITGSYGKTSTKNFLFSLLSSKYRCLKTEGNINSQIGIAQFALKNLKKEHQIFICEIGAYNKGTIDDTCRMVRPRIGILTGISQQHIALFGSQENIIQAKFELIKSLPKDGVAVVNWDNEKIKNNLKIFAGDIKTRLCSAHEKADVWAENISVGTEKLSFRVFSKNENPAEFVLNLAGRQNIINFLMAFACAYELGLSIDEILAASRALTPEQGGIKLYKSKNGFRIIDSSYSANPDGALAALEYLKIWPNRKVVVMPSLIELGTAAAKIHTRIGEKLEESCDLAIITTEEHFASLKKGFKDNEKIVLLKGAEEITGKIKSLCRPGDVVLLEGRVPSKLLDLLLN